MNKTFYEVNERYCIISHDNNNMVICKKDNNLHTFKEILSKENELTLLYDKKKEDIKNLLKSYKIEPQVISVFLTLGSVDALITKFNYLGEYISLLAIATELGIILSNIKMNINNSKSELYNPVLKAKEDLKITNKSIKELESYLKSIKEETGYTIEYDLLVNWYENEVYADITDEREKLIAMRNFLNKLVKVDLEEDISKQESAILKRTK